MKDNFEVPLEIINWSGHFKKQTKPNELSFGFIDIRGGDDYNNGGQNEHGEPHFHIIDKNNIDLCKIFL